MASISIQIRSRPRIHRGAQQGFTLIEMAIAVAIFGLLASGAVLATSAWLGKQALDRTAKNLDRIESAITVFMVQNGNLPCPYLGAAGTFAGNCTGAGHYVGLVPYRHLGLQRTDVLDGWNRYITYAVDDSWSDDQTATNTPYLDATAGNTLRQLNNLPVPDAALDVRDATNQPCANPLPAANCAAYVLVSHGEDGNGAYIGFAGARRPNSTQTSLAEDENNDDDAVFAAEARAADAQFDHIVRFRTPGQILRDAW